MRVLLFALTVSIAMASEALVMLRKSKDTKPYGPDCTGTYWSQDELFRGKLWWKHESKKCIVMWDKVWYVTSTGYEATILERGYVGGGFDYCGQEELSGCTKWKYYVSGTSEKKDSDSTEEDNEPETEPSDGDDQGDGSEKADAPGSEDGLLDWLIWLIKLLVRFVQSSNEFIDALNKASADAAKNAKAGN